MASYNWPPQGSGGSGGSDVVAAGVVNLTSGISSIIVNYDVTLLTAIPPIFSFANATDANPIFLIGYVSAFSTTGFTVVMNAQTDSANYKLSYVVAGAV